MAGLETILGAAAETTMRQATTMLLMASFGAALLLTVAWALAGLVEQSR